MEDSDVNNGSISNAGNLEIGGWTSVPGDFDGIIDNVMIWNRAFTPQEIQELYVNPYGMFKKTDVALWKSAITVPPTYFMKPIINIF